MKFFSIALGFLPSFLLAEEAPYSLPPVAQAGPTMVQGPFGPTVSLEGEQSPIYRTATAPVGLDQPLVSPAAIPSSEAKLPGAKDGVLQNISFSTTWLPKGGSSDLGITDLEISTTLGFPFPTARSPLLLTPAFGVHYLDGPDGPDLPARLYDSSFEFRWIRPIGDRFTVDLAVSPGVFGDYEIDDSDAIRIPGRGLGVWKVSETLTLALGIAYLDRSDISLLPIGGVIWSPNDRWRFEFVSPRPRIAWRIGWFNDACVDCSRDPSHWLYVAGEFGGGSWAIERPTGSVDELTMRDYRLLLGLERKVPGAINSRVELGYVFGRELEFRSATPDFEPEDTLLLRAGASY